MVRPQVASVSQTERLVSAMTTGAITHGQRVRADIHSVEVAARLSELPLVYFCRMNGITIRRTIEAGDGGPLPHEVAVRGLAVNHEGFYNLRNALVSSNGKIEIELDDESSVELVGDSVYSIPLGV